MGGGTIKFEDFILSETTFYCRDGGMSGCIKLPVNITNNTNTDCCSYLNQTGNNSVNSECTISNGKLQFEKM